MLVTFMTVPGSSMYVTKMSIGCMCTVYVYLCGGIRMLTFRKVRNYDRKTQLSVTPPPHHLRNEHLHHHHRQRHHHHNPSFHQY
jgi:hypothetical protein